MNDTETTGTTEDRGPDDISPIASGDEDAQNSDEAMSDAC